MSPSSIAISRTTELWDDKILSATETSSDESKFSDVLNDDFLLMDDGLEIEDDDFDGLLDINPSGAFESEDKDDSDDTTHSVFNIHDDTSSGKRTADFAVRSESPPPKKARFAEASSPTSVTAITSVAYTTSFSSLPSLSNENSGVPDKYQLALQHLALSMRRSEMTRNEIIRQRKEAEIKAKLAAAQIKTVSNAENFLTGNRITLTKGLEQSRRMLQSFISGAKTLPL